MYKNILFDLDGTLTNPSEGITRSVRLALEVENIVSPSEADLTWVIGPPLRDSFRLLAKTTDEELVTRLMHHYRTRYAPTGVFENIMFPEMPKVLRDLQNAGAKLYVATSKLADYAKRILDYFELTSYFTYIGGPTLENGRDAKADVIEDVLLNNHLIASECIMVGDREHDVYGAKANGIETIGVLYGFGSEEELKNAGAWMTVATPE
jgi:phosphoglycolate phosphatase